MPPLSPPHKDYLLALVTLFSLTACNSNKPEAASTTRTDTLPHSTEVKTNPEPDTADYKVYQWFEPQMLPGCKQVTVCLLEDKKLSGPESEIRYYPAYHAARLFFSSDELILNPDGPVCKPAILLIRSTDGAIISRTVLDVPSARIDTAYLDEGKTHLAYLFTKDYSTGMGSYNGPMSCFVRFADTGMVCFKGDDEFVSTLKSAWVMRYSPDYLEIWSKLCRPGDSDDFDITTFKNTLHADSFTSVKMVKKGLWEDEGDTSSQSINEFFEEFLNPGS